MVSKPNDRSGFRYNVVCGEKPKSVLELPHPVHREGDFVC